MSKIVNCRKSKYDVYIGRPSKWGNPFQIGIDGTRNEVIEKYRNWILSKPALLKDLPELEGKTLGCFCFPRKCHGNVLLELLSKLRSGENLSKGNELSPCPFCGSAAVVYLTSEDYESYRITCKGEDCRCGTPDCLFKTSEEAIYAWNLRTISN